MTYNVFGGTLNPTLLLDPAVPRYYDFLRFYSVYSKTLDLLHCRTAMLTRQGGLEQEVVDETATSLAPMLLSGNKAQRRSIVKVLDGLNVNPNVVVEALVSMLEDTSQSQVGSQSCNEMYIIICNR